LQHKWVILARDHSELRWQGNNNLAVEPFDGHNACITARSSQAVNGFDERTCVATAGVESVPRVT
jgi:hypothetical protein